MSNQINDLTSGRFNQTSDSNAIRQQLTFVSGETAALESVQNALNKEVMVYLSKIQVGDILKGQMVSQDGQAYLKLENGLKLSAQFLQQVVADKLQEFIVAGKGRQHLELQLKQPEGIVQDAAHTVMDQAAKQLGITDNIESRTVVSQFMAKQLPLIKQQLVQVMQFAKHFNLPEEALTNLVSRQMPINHEEIQQLAAFKGNEVENINSQLEQLLADVPQSQSSKVADVIQQLFAGDKIAEFVLKDGTTNGLKNPASLQNGQQPADEMNALPKGESVESGTVQGQRADEGLKEALNGKDLPQMSQELSDNGALLSQLLKSRDIKELKNLFKALIADKMTVSSKALEEQGELEKLAEGGAVLKKIAAELGKAEIGGIDYSKLQQLQDLGETLDNYNANAQYFCFPFQINEEKAEGELYFFKPKKNKKGSHTGSYIVLALDMPHINKIEIHVKENADKVDLLLKVKDKKIKALIDEHRNALSEMIQDTAFHIGEIECQLPKESVAEADLAHCISLSSVDARI